MDCSEIPCELWEAIFYYLDHEDLWRCLAVSQRWREVANTNRLWKARCIELGIEQYVEDLSSEGCNDLCLWASIYVTYYLMPTRNWKTGTCKIFDIPVINSHFIDIWEGNRGVVYYYHMDKLIIYEVGINEVRSFEVLCFKNLPREIFTISIGMSGNYVAVSNNNVVIVFKRNAHGYEPFKFAAYFKDKLKFKCYDEELIKSMFSFDTSLQVKAVTNDYLWLRGNFIDRLFVVEISSGKVVSYEDLSYFRFSIICNYVASWDEGDIKLFDKSGKLIFQSNVDCWDLCFNRNIIVIGNKSTQMVETWDIKAGVKLVSKNVLYQTDMVIDSRKNLVVLAEKSKIIYRFTCFDATNGSVIWQMFPPASKRRCHDFKIVSNYVFIWHSFLSRPKYSLLDIFNGKVISEGLLPESKCHFSDCLWVYLDYDNFKIKCYLGFRTET